MSSQHCVFVANFSKMAHHLRRILHARMVQHVAQEISDATVWINTRKCSHAMQHETHTNHDFVSSISSNSGIGNRNIAAIPVIFDNSRGKFKKKEIATKTYVLRKDEARRIHGLILQFLLLDQSCQYKFSFFHELLV